MIILDYMASRAFSVVLFGLSILFLTDIPVQTFAKAFRFYPFPGVTSTPFISHMVYYSDPQLGAILPPQGTLWGNGVII